MQLNHIKRSISLMLVLVMVLSWMPVHAFAAGTEHDHDHAADTVISAEATDTVQSVYQQPQALADALLLKYLGTTTITEEEILRAVDAMD